ncbi:hypothetical protein DTO271G3_7693 [Paecilomyces variotii]|nr:hypothetical protein DTO271G3_7693 [Paecilomyces variotii]
MYGGTTSWPVDWNPRYSVGLSTASSLPNLTQFDHSGGFILSNSQYDTPQPQYPKPHPSSLPWNPSQRQIYASGHMRPLSDVQHTTQAEVIASHPYMVYQNQMVTAPIVQTSYPPRFDPLGLGPKPPEGLPLNLPVSPHHRLGIIEPIQQQSLASSPIKSIRVGDEATMVAYYESAFHALQQTNCRMIAKAFIKVVEPRKQAKYPYNGGKGPDGKKGDSEKTKPAWWPTKVTHREPDHLKKPERVRLLIHLLRGLDKRRGITVDQLEDAGRSIRRRIKPADRLDVLAEVYRVRRVEERYENGEIDGNTEIYVVDRGWKTSNDEENRSPTPTLQSENTQNSPTSDSYPRSVSNSTPVTTESTPYRESAGPVQAPIHPPVQPPIQDQHSPAAYMHHYGHNMTPRYR